jgi:thiosulfate/3-mercaptopyruvate sulfurtransferase
MTEMLLSAGRLAELIQSNSCVVVDCRFDLSQPQKSRQDYLDGHIPQAVYAHLDEHLSSAITPQSGRHPMPGPESFALFLVSIGWQEDKLLVAYDAGNNAFSARLWWLMRYFGLAAALLDGGLEAWKRAGFTLQQGSTTVAPGTAPILAANDSLTVSAADILRRKGELTLIDARAAERYSGATEPLDSAAGHIPGALNRPLAMNLDAQGQFKSRDQLREDFRQLLPDVEVNNVVHYCGSGVTACHNAFAMEWAGIGVSRIYPGSWSEWIRDPSRPIETSL